MSQRAASPSKLKSFRDSMRAFAERCSPLMFLVGFALWLVCAILGTTSFYTLPFVPVVKTIGLLLLIVAEALYLKVAPKSLVVCVVVAALAWHANLHDPAYMVVIVYCAQHQDLKRVITVALVVELVTCAAVVICSYAGLAANVVIYQAGRTRYSLGFSYVSFLSHYCLNIVLMWIYLRREKGTLIEVALLLAMTVFVMAWTVSRMPFGLTVLALVVFCAYRFAYNWKRKREGWPHPTKRRKGNRGARALFSPKRTRGIRVAVGAAPWLFMAVFSLLLLVVDAQSTFGAALNQVLTGRISLSQKAFSEYSVGLLGQPIDWRTFSSAGNQVTYVSDYLVVDNSYLHVLLQGGLIVFVVSLWLLTKTSIRAVWRKDWLLVGILWACALHSFIDPQMLDLQYSCFLLLMAYDFRDDLHPVWKE